MKAQMKCCIMWHFIRVGTVLFAKTEMVYRERNTIYFGSYNLLHLKIYNGPFQVYVSNQMEESISVYRVKSECETDNYFSYFSTKTYVVGTQKNRLNETVLLSTQNTCLKGWVSKQSQCYAKKLLIWPYG